MNAGMRLIVTPPINESSHSFLVDVDEERVVAEVRRHLPCDRSGLLTGIAIATGTTETHSLSFEHLSLAWHPAYLRARGRWVVETEEKGGRRFVVLECTDPAKGKSDAAELAHAHNARSAA